MRNPKTPETIGRLFSVRESEMLQTFYPDEDVKSAYDIDYEAYRQKGYQAIIYDIDNTLVEHGAPATDKSRELIERLKGLGYEVMVLSNNKEPRVKSFADAHQIRYIYKANKPSPKQYQAAMVMMGSNPENTLFIGDQLFTDVWGAKLAGIHSILVGQIAKHEEIQIVLKRKLERIVLHFYEKQKTKK
ncbi:MAG: YqeG family HAD IIIA-type phosphatase [Lachnospiraceae bacterium]|nr:YqeG family HAD IIIA-type phosphatase [Lachnospiraceae bacterium]